MHKSCIRLPGASTLCMLRRLQGMEAQVASLCIVWAPYLIQIQI